MRVMNSRRFIVAPEAQARTTYREELSNTVGSGMSALGQERTFRDVRTMSALPTKADISYSRRY